VIVLLFMCMVGRSKSLYGWQVRTNLARSLRRLIKHRSMEASGNFSNTGDGPFRGQRRGCHSIWAKLSRPYADLKILTEQETLTRINKQGLGGLYSNAGGC
jgi:hypothetical protein